MNVAVWSRRLIVPVLWGLLILPVARAWAQEARFEALADTVPGMMAAAGVPGLALAVIEDGTVAWARGFGVRSTVTNPPVEAGTVFEAASLSKPVFAYLTLQLVDEGALDLDRPLAEYLPYADIAHDPRYRKITARMVLNHTTGFPNWRPPGDSLRLDFDPGTRFQYSGEGFVYLQKVVEHLTGMPLRVLAVRRVFEPLGMTQSSFVWEDRFGPAVAAGHREDGVAFDKFVPQVGNAAWSLHTTVQDYARFMIAVMNGEGLSTTLHRAMLSPQADAEAGMRWGLGWGLQPAGDDLAFWHWGDNVGYKSFAIAFPRSRRGLVFLSNSNNGMLLLHALLKETFGQDQPAADWLGYDRYDDPQYQIRAELYDVLLKQDVAAAIARYHELKAEAAYPPVAFEEDMLNTLGYRLLRTGRVEDAIEIFKLNVEMFPNAYNPYDSLGEAYMVQGDLRRALENYQKSVELNPENEHGARMIKRLRAALFRQP
ncbi:class A beta-lactamase-related serine hydrolase [Rhodocaloribacter litoris]|uniref:class A beta-lactamase-related serine hydrolase n=1 Tax=Rhodocaloribacter litoris TaxID=2558931 RepID=UPI001E418E25|nr:class A beta-lactamase-related serine hydrolase [Rhodocaloribacter litoris]QXD13828.1 class A beta-lactamase-related serine hydrolase [Rhodocaloribacter litoris]